MHLYHSAVKVSTQCCKTLIMWVHPMGYSRQISVMPLMVIH